MEKLRILAEEMGITLSEQQLAQFQTYFEMLVEKNKVMNLTAITEKEDVILKHFADSLAVYRAVPEFKEAMDAGKKLSVIDVGTGAGFPGLPLKIAFPNLQITLFDSLNKRILFLDEVIAALKLTDIDTKHGRAEDGARLPAMRGKYDLAVSRAVANMAVLSEYLIPFVKQGGSVIAYKSAEIEEELNEGKKAISVLGGKVTTVQKMTLPQSDIERTFVVIKKVKATPKQYPRKAGTAAKSPIH